MRLLLTGVSLLVISSVTVPAKAACTTGLPRFSSNDAVPVYVDYAFTGVVEDSSGHVWTYNEVLNEVRWAVGTLSATRANLPNLYAVPWYGPPPANYRVPGAIFVTPARHEIESPPYCAASVISTGSPANGFTIPVGTMIGGCSTPWERESSLMGVLLHELIHVMGLHHRVLCEEVCDSHPEIPCANMSTGDAFGATQIYDWDIDNLVELYGYRPSPEVTHRESSTGTTWSSLPTTGAPELLPGFDLSDVGGSYMGVLGRRTANRWVTAYLWDWGSLTWTNEGSSFSGILSQNAVGMDIDGLNLRGFQQQAETHNNVVKYHSSTRWAYTGDIDYTASTDYFTTRQGVDIAYDPFSGDYFAVYAWMDGSLFLMRVDPVSGAVLEQVQIMEASGSPVQIVGAPSITCGDASITRNCLIAWADRAVPHRLKHMHFFAFPVSPLAVNQGPIVTGPWLQGPARVAYSSAGNYHTSFVLLGNNDGRYATWTGRKSAAEAAQWGDYRSHVYDFGVQSASIGASNGYAELLVARWD